MKLISWNVNGLRACITKGFNERMSELSPDIICLQEIKMLEGQAEVALDGYFEYWNSAEKKGYSGTAIFTKIKPISAVNGIGKEEHDHEGRVITLEFEDFFLVNVYTPNSKRELERLAYRMIWEDELRAYLINLDKKKSVVLCGDLNVAHKEIDLKNPKSNIYSAGFTNEERQKMTELLSSGFSDTFRVVNGEDVIAYSWWSYMNNARSNNAGWRIDYFIVSNRLIDKVTGASIHPQILGSDHCPVELIVEL